MIELRLEWLWIRIDSDREADGSEKKVKRTSFIHGFHVDVSMVFQEANPTIERCSGEGSGVGSG